MWNQRANHHQQWWIKQLTPPTPLSLSFSLFISPSLPRDFTESSADVLIFKWTPLADSKAVSGCGCCERLSSHSHLHAYMITGTEKSPDEQGAERCHGLSQSGKRWNRLRDLQQLRARVQGIVKTSKTMQIFFLLPVSSYKLAAQLFHLQSSWYELNLIKTSRGFFGLLYSWTFAYKATDFSDVLPYTTHTWLCSLSVSDALMETKKLVFVHLFNQSVRLIYKQQEEEPCGWKHKTQWCFQQQRINTVYYFCVNQKWNVFFLFFKSPFPHF